MQAADLEVGFKDMSSSMQSDLDMNPTKALLQIELFMGRESAIETFSENQHLVQLVLEKIQEILGDQDVQLTQQSRTGFGVLCEMQFALTSAIKVQNSLGMKILESSSIELNSGIYISEEISGDYIPQPSHVEPGKIFARTYVQQHLGGGTWEDCGNGLYELHWEDSPSSEIPTSKIQQQVVEESPNQTSSNTGSEESQNVPPGTPQDLLSDLPIDLESEDLLGLKEIAESFANFIHHPNTKTPFVLAINAQWGAGKTSLTNLIARKLERRGLKEKINAWIRRSKNPSLVLLREWLLLNSEGSSSWKWGVAIAKSRDHSQRLKHSVSCFNAWYYDDSPNLTATFAQVVTGRANDCRSLFNQVVPPDGLEVEFASSERSSNWRNSRRSFYCHGWSQHALRTQ